MKRVVVCCVAAVVAVAALGQKAVVNDVKKAVNQLKTSATDYTNAINKLKPALTHEQTADRSETWLINAKIHIGLHDRLGDAARVGKKVDVAKMEHALVDAYSSLDHCMSIDTTWLKDDNGLPILNKKTGQPRFKTKHSREATRLINEYLPQIYTAGNRLFNLGDWQGAYDAWQHYCRHTVASDTIVPSIRYYQAISLWHQQDYKAASALFAAARQAGYKKADAYDYALSCLEAIGDTAAIVNLAHEAFAALGTTRPRYLRIIINDCIATGKFEDANRLLDTAIANDSTNAELLNSKGFIIERQHDINAALPYYQRALACAPDNHIAQLNMGRYYYNQAVKQRFHNTQASLDLYRQAMPLLENAYEHNRNSRSVREALRDIYYRLGLADRLTAIEQH